MVYKMSPALSDRVLRHWFGCISQGI